MSLKHKFLLSVLICCIGIVCQIVAFITDITTFGIISMIAFFVGFPTFLANLENIENRKAKNKKGTSERGQGDGSVVTSKETESVD